MAFVPRKHRMLRYQFLAPGCEEGCAAGDVERHHSKSRADNFSHLVMVKPAASGSCCPMHNVATLSLESLS